MIGQKKLVIKAGRGRDGCGLPKGSRAAWLKA
jgi:hypothetical protein